jgi:type VI secretion system protein ImpG
VSDELLPYYQRELTFFRRMAADFAEEHPEVAADLLLGADSCEDPHVERMILAFALMAARIRHKLDDDFPEITSALLGALYPHYLAPVPSMAVAEFHLDRAQADLTGGYPIERGRTVETEAIDGEPCRFHTCYPVTLWPIEVSSATLTEIPFSSSITPESAVAVLRLHLQTFADELTFSQLKLEKLRFYLNGQAQHVLALYEMLFNNTVEVTLSSAIDDPQPVLLGKESILPVGFEKDEGLLPFSARSFPGYRLLTEYFAFPQKFCFFDLGGLSPENLGRLAGKVEVCFYMNRTTADLEQNVSGGMFRLGCTPVANLFKKWAEPIRLTHTEFEYRVNPDARRPRATEIYSLDRVSATSPSGEKTEFQPFYSFKHGVSRKEERAFWYARRKPARKGLDPVDHGTEVFLSLVDLDFDPTAPADWSLDIEATCLNRDLPGQLPFGGGQPALTLAGGGPLSGISCLTKPTPTFRPDLLGGTMWRIISHLSLNHLSIFDAEGKPDGLREILKIYDYANSPETQAKIAGILRVESRRALGRVKDDMLGSFCRGVEVDIQFDEERYSDNGMFLFACILERFLGLYCSLNSFTRLAIRTKQRKETLRTWPPRAADRVLG